MNSRRQLGLHVAAMLPVGLLLSDRGIIREELKNVTFSKDIVPIFQEKCQDCHRPHHPGPMSLVRYSSVEELDFWIGVLTAAIALCIRRSRSLNFDSNLVSIQERFFTLHSFHPPRSLPFLRLLTFEGRAATA